MNMVIDIADPRWSDLGDIEALCQAAWDATIPGDPREVSALFTSDDEMRSINKQWRGKDAPTNVLSFPAAQAPVQVPQVPQVPQAPQGPQPLGDIVLSYETVMLEAEASRKPALHHTSHLVIHGLLHLIGHDHETEDEAVLMEDRERRILASLGIADPYAERGAP